MSIDILKSELEYPMENIRKARCKLSQKDFAKAIGMSWRTYENWIADGRAPKLSPDQMRNLCKICKVDANTLLDVLTGEIDIEEVPVSYSQNQKENLKV
ncbi:MAG TPA: hypothetical protein DD761_03500 [Cyanobacteria bacterium UBA11691]|nr:hypothetical protein [Cyanobacteria bacterium UBA11691]